MQTTLTSKGQMTLPATIRSKMGLKSGDKLEVSLAQDDSIILRRKRAQPISALHGMLAKPKKALTIEQMNQAAGRLLAAKHKAKQL